MIVGSKGRREIPVEQVPVSPGRTSLAKDEFILEFKFPPRPARSGDAYLRFIPRTEMDIAVVGCGINVTLDDKGVCTAARCSLGAVAPTVLLVKEMADALVGHTLDDATLAAIDKAAQAACKPINDKRGTIEYRTKVAARATRGTRLWVPRANSPRRVAACSVDIVTPCPKVGFTLTTASPNGMMPAGIVACLS